MQDSSSEECQLDELECTNVYLRGMPGKVTFVEGDIGKSTRGAQTLGRAHNDTCNAVLDIAQRVDAIARIQQAEGTHHLTHQTTSANAWLEKVTRVKNHKIFTKL